VIRASGKPGPVWLFDLDNTLHDASSASMPGINQAMTAYIERELKLTREEADALRRRYWLRYGATLLGLVRHHGVRASHFLHDTHLLPGLEARVRGHVHDLHALARLPGRRVLLTNAPLAYTTRVLGALGIGHLFEAVVTMDHMRMFGHLRPKPDARMLRWLAARLGVPPSRCVLVEDTLEHQKSARSVGMQTVWMQRWLARPAGPPASPASPVRRWRLHRRPAYVGVRVRRLSELSRRPRGPRRTAP
jgi:putative hydrolase of the HAD superfamily